VNKAMLSARTATIQFFVIVHNRGSHSGFPAYAPVVLLSEASASWTHKVTRGSPAAAPHHVRFRDFVIQPEPRLCTLLFVFKTRHSDVTRNWWKRDCLKSDYFFDSPASF